MAAGACLLLLLHLPTSEAQVPVPGQEAALHIAVLCTDGFLEPDYTQTDVISCVVQDFSRDSVGIPGGAQTGPSIHTVFLSTRPAPGSENVTGWQILVSQTALPMRGGESRPIEIRASPTPAINSDEYSFELVAEYSTQSGYNQTIVVPLTAQVNPYGFALTSWTSSPSRRAGQDEIVVYDLAITNDGVYPDVYQLDVVTDDALRVTTPPNVYVAAGETRVVQISVLTPKGKLYEMGLSIPLVVKITSLGVGDVPGTGIYTAAATLQVRGFYVPVYWIPLVLVGLVSTGVLVGGVSEKRTRRRLERGTPRPVAMTPRQAVLLAELKRQDPDAYKSKRSALDLVYKERVADYRGHRKERLDADREEARQARVEFLAQKKARKAQRREEAKARAQQKRADKIEARETRKRERLLAKARKKLLKAQRKQQKIEAKQAAKQAKIDAKQAKKDAAAAKAAAREQAKAEKAAAKVAKKAGKEPPK